MALRAPTLADVPLLDAWRQAAGTESEKQAPGRTENGGIELGQDPSGTTGTSAEASSRDF